MTLGMKAVSEVKEANVTLLTDADIRFVSLVKHGANRSPFRVIKEDKGGDKMTMVIQSILVPTDSSLEELSKKENCEWAIEAKSDQKEEFDTYNKFVQIPEEKFEKGSLQLSKLNADGTFAMVGVLKDGESKEALTIPEKKMDIPISPMDSAVAESEGPAFVLTFRDMFDRELSSFLDVVRGTMSQSKVDAKKRKASVMSALNAFGNFLSIGIDAIDKNAKPGKKEEEDNAVGEAADKILKALEDGKKLNGGSDMTLFATKEEFVTAVTEVVDAVLTKKEDEAKKARDKEANNGDNSDNSENKDNQDNKDNGTPDPTLDAKKEDAESIVTQKMDKLATDFEALKTSFEEFGNGLNTDPAGNNDFDDGSTGDDNKGKPSVFAGLFVNKSQKEAGASA